MGRIKKLLKRTKFLDDDDDFQEGELDNEEITINSQARRGRPPKNEDINPEIQKRQDYLQKVAELYTIYRGAYSAETFQSIRPDFEICNLLFGIFDQARQSNELLKENNRLLKELNRTILDEVREEEQ